MGIDVVVDPDRQHAERDDADGHGDAVWDWGFDPPERNQAVDRRNPHQHATADVVADRVEGDVVRLEVAAFSPEELEEIAHEDRDARDH